ncbi:hypothetical protein N9Z38_00425 [Mariniblastus sp.]|nr:hypothetical protein [Mariniblastus sp.]
MSDGAPADWKYKGYVDKDRVKQFLIPKPFTDLVTEILESCSATTDIAIQPNNDELRLAESKETAGPRNCRRVVFHLVIPKHLHDYLINSPFGLFGKYNSSPEEGRKRMSEFIQAIKNESSIMAVVQTSLETESNTDAMPSEQLIDLSLNPQYAVVWFDEGEFPKEKFKRDQGNFVGPAAPQIWAGKWRGRPVFNAGTRLVIKGVWVTTEGKLAVSKADLDFQLYLRGFS